jgi:hypothetical protein
MFLLRLLRMLVFVMLGLWTITLVGVCKDSPVAPTPPPPVPPVSPDPPPSGDLNPSLPKALPPTGFEGWVRADSKARARATNLTDEDRKLILACYCDPTRRLKDQVLQSEWVERVVPPGRSVQMKLGLPRGAYQCDLVTRLSAPLSTPTYRLDQLVAFTVGGEGPCQPPPPAPPKDPPEPPPPPPPPPSCPLEKPNPECPEQVWDEQSCRWVGDCPALQICHVSNKGGDRDWNIQENQKKYTPGHEHHLNACPPDYFGTCDGRWDNGHPCTDGG